MSRVAFLILLAVAAAGCNSIELLDPVDPVGPVAPVDPAASPLRGLTLEQVAEGLSEPSALASPPGDERLFVLERPGRLRIIDDGRLLIAPALDLTADIDTRGERGLTGIAFHPRFRDNRKVYLLYETLHGSGRLVEYLVNGFNRNRLDPESARVILEMSQEDFFHQGGDLEFGPEGYLWVTFGDDGAIGDPNANGQDPTTLDGTVLRIDVDSGDPYVIPPDNPFADGAGGAPEVWAFGLRNPWRIAIDAPSRLLYVPDVGQFTWEEINVAPLDEPGLNFGWPIREGDACYEADRCETSGFAEPVLVYGHDEGCAVIGGPVYRGHAIPEITGQFFYGDHCGGWVRSIEVDASGLVASHDWTADLGQIPSITSFGTDALGEIYLTTLDGKVYRIVPVRG